MSPSESDPQLESKLGPVRLAAIEESRRKLADLEKDRPIWEAEELKRKLAETQRRLREEKGRTDRLARKAERQSNGPCMRLYARNLTIRRDPASSSTAPKPHSWIKQILVVSHRNVRGLHTCTNWAEPQDRSFHSGVGREPGALFLVGVILCMYVIE